MKVKDLDEKFVKEITQTLFEEWKDDYETLTDWKSQPLLEQYYLDHLCSNNKKTINDIPFALIATEINSETGIEEWVGISIVANEDMQMRPDLGPWLAIVFVKPSHRRRGIAAKLIESAILKYKKLRPNENLYLWTFDKVLSDYYIQFGFQLMQIVQEHGNRENVYLMRLSETSTH